MPVRNRRPLRRPRNLDGYYYKPRFGKELLAKRADGLMGTPVCLSGEVLKRLGQAPCGDCRPRFGPPIHPSIATISS